LPQVPAKGLLAEISTNRSLPNIGLPIANLMPLEQIFVPAVVLGMALPPFMRAIGLWVSKLSIAIAYSLWSLPVVFLVTRSALEGVDPDLEPAASGLFAAI